MLRRRSPPLPFLSRAVAWCLMLLLPLLGLSVTLTFVLGPLHHHKVSTVSAGDSMMGWSDLRRVADAAPLSLSAHAHNSLGRHLYDRGDRTVVRVDPDLQDALEGDSSPASNTVAVFASDRSGLMLALVLQRGRATWGPCDPSQFRNCDARRLDRPPKA